MILAIFLTPAVLYLHPSPITHYPSLAFAEEISLHGFVQGNYAARITGEEPSGPGGGDFLLGEERLQIKLAASSKGAGFFLKTDFFRDAVARVADLEVRESYLDYGAGALDLRVGRQIVTWGVGDLLFINDIFPKDYAAFFSGRPLEYLKIGSDAAKADLFTELVSAELVVIPFFEPDRLPTSDRFFLFDPFPTVADRTQTEPRSEFENTELALRLYRTLLGFDSSVYAYKGFFRAPAMQPDDPLSPTQITLFFPRLRSYGASAQGNAVGGVVSLEAGYYDSRDDRSGKDPAVSNSMVKYLIGHQRQLWSEFTAGIQYYGEYLLDYDAYRDTLPAGFPAQDRLRQLLTVRLTQMLRYQTVKLSLFAFYSPTDQDYYLIPEARYGFTDALWGAIGANIFGGEKEATFFGQLDKNDNLYVTMRYEF